MSKVCTKCGVEKDESEFRLRTSRGEKLVVATCLSCERDAARRRASKKRASPEYRDYMAAYRRKNSVTLKVQYRTWYVANAEKLREKARCRSVEYRKACIDDIRKRNRNYYVVKRKQRLAYEASRREELHESYVVRALSKTGRVGDFPRDLIDLKREQLLIHRLTKQLLNTIKEKEDERSN